MDVKLSGIVFLLACFAVFTGCATSSAELKVAPGLSIVNSPADFAQQCRDLLLQREYGRTERCLEDKRQQVDAYKSAFENEFDPNTRLGGYKRKYELMFLSVSEATAELLLDYGESHQAYETIFKALPGSDVNVLDEKVLIRVHRLAGVAAGLQGNKKLAAEQIGFISKVEGGTNDAREVSVARKFAIVDILLAMEDYAGTQTIMAQPYDVNFSDIMRLGLSIYLHQSPANSFESTMQVNQYIADTQSIFALPPGEDEAFDFRSAKVNYKIGNKAVAEVDYRFLLGKQYFEQQYPGLYISTLEDLASIAENNGNDDESFALLYKAIDIIEKQRRNITESASRITYQSNHAKIYGKLVQRLIGKGRVEEALVVAERAKCRELVESLASRELESSDQGGRRRIPDVSLETLRKHLDADSAMIYYYQVDSHLYAWYLTDSSLRFAEINKAQLDRFLPHYLSAVRHPDDENLMGLSQTLYNLLLRPLEIERAKPHLLIVPAMGLHYLPFSTLHDGDFFLVDNYYASILPNFSILTLLANYAAPPSRNALVYGNPDSEFPMLEDGANEANWVASLNEHSEVIQKENATEIQFRKQAGQFGIIHYAGHAAFTPFNPLDSALLMAAGEGQDGRLTVKEIYDLRIKAELVTLSACETAVSGFDNGDEIIGLNQGFLFAGARGVLASLWKVSDQETYELMQHFYRSWPRYPKAVALQLAQLKLRETHPHPYYWASFQLSGI